MGPWDLIKEMKMGGERWRGRPRNRRRRQQRVEVRRTEPHQRTLVAKQAERRRGGQAAGPKARLGGVGVLCSGRWELRRICEIPENMKSVKTKQKTTNTQHLFNDSVTHCQVPTLCEALL